MQVSVGIETDTAFHVWGALGFMNPFLLHRNENAVYQQTFTKPHQQLLPAAAAASSPRGSPHGWSSSISQTGRKY